MDGALPARASIPELRDVDPAHFRGSVMAGFRPVVLRGLVRDWPAVREALTSPEALARHIAASDLGRPVETFVGPPAIGGRFFYDAGMSGFNFERRGQSLSQTLSWLVSHMDDEAPPSVYAGAVDVRTAAPGFAQEARIDLVDEKVAPRVWVGNAIEVSPHFDQSHNIACVVAGRRRFTLFPPEQAANLYVGPLEFTVAGQPMGLVSPDAPDLERYPRFRQALESATSATLEPGDAIYIPPLWWHHVRSLEPFNLLVNYWWEEAPPGSGSPFEALVHGLLAIRSLPEAERRAWRALFDHYVFQTGEDAAAHLEPHVRGVLGPLTPELSRQIRAFLARGLQRG
jgi:hypothetical protein